MIQFYKRQDDVLAGELWFYQGCLRHETSEDDGVDGECGEGRGNYTNVVPSPSFKYFRPLEGLWRTRFTLQQSLKEKEIIFM